MDQLAGRRPYFIEEDDGLASLTMNQHHYSSIYRPNITALSEPHFLEACFLCKKRLGENKDIYMYRGDTPFCSVECRQQQIENDEAREKSWNLSGSMTALRNKDKKRTSNSQEYPLQTGTVAVV
ncbi:Hypothetical predicted protein [Olea europaea subsp. europaea]|uniref:FLZ-type domain-containing protein n=1 Tax=Olea europaea subsp. europaea TaxID=158383 RepID=A0A8S0SFN3_OLEEU|nr:Hypothetical predicted protein [Olea europaea subsp. europaea]